MQIYDFGIIAIIGLFAIKGFYDGFFKTVVSFVGFIIIVVLAYNLKDIVGNFLVLNFPFFEFKNFLWSSGVINIIFYQGIAFILMFLILEIIYKIVLMVTGIIEKLLKLTVVLAIPSKLLGLFLGFLEGYIVVYLILFFLAQPFVTLDVQSQSNFMNPILEKTPILSHFGEKSLQVFNEIKALNDIDDRIELDLAMADIVLKEKVISPGIFQKLVNSGKINIEGIEEVIDKYK